MQPIEEGSVAPLHHGELEAGMLQPLNEETSVAPLRHRDQIQVQPLKEGMLQPRHLTQQPLLEGMVTPLPLQLDKANGYEGGEWVGDSTIGV